MPLAEELMRVGQHLNQEFRSQDFHQDCELSHLGSFSSSRATLSPSISSSDSVTRAGSLFWLGKFMLELNTSLLAALCFVRSLGAALETHGEIDEDRRCIWNTQRLSQHKHNLDGQHGNIQKHSHTLVCAFTSAPGRSFMFILESQMAQFIIFRFYKFKSSQWPIRLLTKRRCNMAKEQLPDYQNR